VGTSLAAFKAAVEVWVKSTNYAHFSITRKMLQNTVFINPFKLRMRELRNFPLHRDNKCEEEELT